jgi:DNA-binding GntR family transcriptional regulator
MAGRGSRKLDGQSGRRELWLIIRDQVAARIASGELAPDSRLPPELAMAAELGVSRATLREALRSLEEDGLLTRTRSRGTFVTHRPWLRNNLDVNFGVTDAIRAAGMTPGTKSLKVIEDIASRDEAHRLGIATGDAIFVVERIRTANKRPVVYSRDVLPAALVSGRTALLQALSRESIYDTLYRELGLVLQYGIASIEPRVADHSLAGELGIKEGGLVLYLRQVDYSEAGTPILYSHEWHLADAFEFTVLRRGPGRRMLR